MQDHRRALGRGFNWLGGATIAAKIIDFATVLAMLLFLSKQQVGVASLVISIGMVVEALNGLGTGEALIQARSVSRPQLDTLFWYVMSAALLVAGLTLAAAPAVGLLYGMPSMAQYFLAIAIKQPLVGAALVPLALMNRSLQFERIAVVNVCATFGAALTRLALAASGAGVWALVAGYAASGLFIMIGAWIARPFRPGLGLQPASIRPLVRFGVRSSASNISEQMFKNIDYMLIGWFYGPALLAVYRVAFDLAMEPAMAVGTLVNRTALPVFARAAGIAAELNSILLWALGKIAFLVTPLMVALMLAAGPLTALLHDSHGASYAAAAMPLRLLAAAALLRIVTQLASTMMIGIGRPGLAARLALTTLGLLASAILVVGCTVPAAPGIVAASAIWLAIYPPVLLWLAVMLRRQWQVRLRPLLAVFAMPVAGCVAMLLLVGAGSLVPGLQQPAWRLALVVVATALAYAGLARYAGGRAAS